MKDLSLFHCSKETKLFLFLALSIIPLLGFLAESALALPRLNPVTGIPDIRILPCIPGARVEGALNKIGLPLIGSETKIDASSVKVVITEGDPNNITRCMTTFRAIPPNGFAWQFLSKPAGSNATLLDTSTLIARFTPDVIGAYTIKFTACPGNSTFPLARGGTITVRETPLFSVVFAVNFIERPPETLPVLPTMTSTPRTPMREVLTGGGLVDPQWVTVNEWRGPQDYEMFEGLVLQSYVSSNDDPLNHESQDWNIRVSPDFPYSRLLNPGQLNIKMEWERDHFPEFFRATPGDRISVMGYWIYDCGHEFDTEIHPPVMTAVHRPRPIRIPQSLGLGSNIIVPGIVTDIWINDQAGEITGNCSLTGLHQPPTLITAPNGQTFIKNGPCLPDAAGFDRNPINRIYEFNIYLPRNPQVTATKAGIQVPPVQLFFQTTDPQGVPEDPVITEQISGEITFLKVRLDLRNYTGHTYSRRIVAGWAYPSPENWGLKSWRLRVNSMTVEDDGDLEGDGDWRFWVNTNNGDQEWTNLLDCNGCVDSEFFGDGTVQFGWETGFPASKSLGPDILLFPEQTILVHTSGFEDDVAFSDDTGFINQSHAQETNSFSIHGQCDPSGLVRCCDYTLHYEIVPGTPPGNPVLTAAGSALYEAYTLRPSDFGNTLTDLVMRFPFPILQQVRNVSSFEIPSDQVLVRSEETAFFERTRGEPNIFINISKDGFLQTLAAAENEPSGDTEVKLFMTELVGEMRQFLQTRSDEDVWEFVQSCKISIPPDLWTEFLTPVLREESFTIPLDKQFDISNMQNWKQLH